MPIRNLNKIQHIVCIIKYVVKNDKLNLKCTFFQKVEGKINNKWFFSRPAFRSVKSSIIKFPNSHIPKIIVHCLSPSENEGVVYFRVQT